MTGNPSLGVASFWHGPRLSALDAACLYSFVLCGFDVTLFCYAPVENAPTGIKLADAEDIVERSFVERFRVQGRPSIPHFADYFRCCLFRQARLAWIDTDVLCLRPFSIDASRPLLAKQTVDQIGNAILWIPPEDPDLGRLIDAIAQKADNRDHAYGASGPDLITKVYARGGLATAHEPAAFFPVAAEKWWLPFLPSERDACVAACAQANVLHLWNNVVDHTGFWKDLLPPAGSYLNEQLTRRGMDSFFEATYPEAVLESIVHNYRILQSCAHLPIKRLLNITAGRLLNYPGKLLSIR